jgi:hypothetical protein
LNTRHHQAKKRTPKGEEGDQGHPTQQPITLESLTNTEPPGISIKFAGIAEAVRQLCRWAPQVSDWLICFTSDDLLQLIGSVAIDLLHVMH